MCILIFSFIANDPQMRIKPLYSHGKPGRFWISDFVFERQSPVYSVWKNKRMLYANNRLQLKAVPTLKGNKNAATLSALADRPLGQ